VNPASNIGKRRFSVVGAERKVASREGVVRRSSARLQRDWREEEGRVENECYS
jgi:hypothetical protein